MDLPVRESPTLPRLLLLRLIVLLCLFPPLILFRNGKEKVLGKYYNCEYSNLVLFYSLVKAMFNMARDRKPTVVFVDEIDSLCASRDVCYCY